MLNLRKVEKKLMLFLDDVINKKSDSYTVLHRIVKYDKKAFEECIDCYGDLIWALAKSKTESKEEAERLTLEIFKDIRNCAKLYDASKCTEKAFIAMIARRRLAVH